MMEFRPQMTKIYMKGSGQSGCLYPCTQKLDD